jgi:hypothetical protein
MALTRFVGFSDFFEGAIETEAAVRPIKRLADCIGISGKTADSMRNTACRNT